MECEGLNVSRETLERLQIYAALLEKWNPAINLVAKSTLKDLWSRHFIDSAQVFDLRPDQAAHWVDIGSGGGFPGLVVAIMAMQSETPLRVSLVESDLRKCTFMRTVIRETSARAEVINERIEAIEPLAADVLSARALADLDTLLSFTNRHLAKNGRAIFLKGENWKKELEIAQRKWKFDYQVDKSRTEIGPVILSITGVASV